MRIIVCVTLRSLLLAACASKWIENPSNTHLRAESGPKKQGVIPETVQQSVTLPRPRASNKSETYSVVVHNIQVSDLLFALARDAKLNVDIHSGITGLVSLNAIDQTLPQLLTRISKQVDMRFELDGPNLVVMPDTPFLKNYKIDYVNMAREVTGTVSTNTQISTGGTGGSIAGTGSAPGVGGGGGGNVSRIRIENISKNRFWESLEKNLKDLLRETDKLFPEGSTETVTEKSNAQSTSGTGAASPTSTATRGSRSTPSLVSSANPATLQDTGATVVKHMTYREAASVISSPESGVITVRASSRQHEKVQEFLDRVMSSARRQVLIEATIVEVELFDGYQQGIQWSRLVDGKTPGLNNNPSDGTGGFILTQPTLGKNVINSVTPFVFSYFNKNNPLNLLTTVNLLQSFGHVKVLSSPKLTVLNNQTATLKVSEEFVYFNVKSDIAAGTLTTGPTKAITTTPQSVSVGFFMSLTAQISDGDTITLNVRPSISSIADLKQDPNPDIPTSIPNYVPQIRTREIESMMRIESGDIAVLGGLMEDRIDNKTGRFPGLGSLPLLGELLNNRSNSSRKTELVIFIRPTVIKDASTSGDYSRFASSLPTQDVYKSDKTFQPFSILSDSPSPELR